MTPRPTRSTVSPMSRYVCPRCGVESSIYIPPWHFAEPDRREPCDTEGVRVDPEPWESVGDRAAVYYKAVLAVAFNERFRGG